MGNTTTTLGAITPGEAKAHCETYRDPASDEYETRVWVTVGKKTICDMPEDCEEQDPDLIADAFNTANKTGKLPSQLKQDVDELVGALRELLNKNWHSDQCKGLDEFRGFKAKGTCTCGYAYEVEHYTTLLSKYNPKP